MLYSVRTLHQDTNLDNLSASAVLHTCQSRLITDLQNYYVQSQSH